jgi:hypothetical protein
VIVAAQESFYEAAAQVIPVLLLVLAVGEASLRPRLSEPSEVSYMAIFTLVFMALGEVVTLGALASGEAGTWAQFFTSASIGIGLGFLIFRFSLLVWEEQKRVPRQEPPWKVALILPTGMGASIVVMAGAMVYLMTL